MRRCPLALSFLVALATVGAQARPAHACGGCFAPATERTVVNAHRMAFSITPKQTVLWDQIRYSGDPREFAWVLPVRAGARVELSREEWFAALDASTQPVVIAPSTGPYGGCALAGCGASADSTALSAGSDNTVHVLAQNVVGPYETATLRSRDGSALVAWLDSHGFVLPAQNRPTVDAYVAEGFDFIALRLRPQCSERAMKPVRIVTPGADPTLPLRMVAAGVGAYVDILLYVVGEGRWRPKNFPEVLFDDTKLSFDTTGVSNYETLAQSLMAQKEGTSWLTEAAGQPDLGGWYPGHPEWSGPSMNATNGFAAANMAAPPNPGLAPTYFAFCHGASIVPGTRSMVVAPQPCASSSAIDSGADDASDAASDGPDGGGDASSADGRAEAANDSALGLAETGADSTPDVEAPDATSDAESWDGADGAVDAEAGAAAAADGADASDEPDAVAMDSGEEASLASGGGDAGGDSGNTYTPAVADPCKGFDDLDVALDGAHPQDIWVTRLRAKLPVFALANDLSIEASPSQTTVSSVHQVIAAPAVKSRQGCVTGTGPRDAFGTGALVTFTVLGLGAIFRRRRG
jgi:hypothetical protein